MGFLRKLVPRPEERWRQYRDALDAIYVEGRGLKSDRIEIPYRGLLIEMEIISVTEIRDAKGTMARVDVPVKTGCGAIAMHNWPYQSIMSIALAVFGRQFKLPGYDESWSISGRDPETAPAMLGSAELRAALQALPPLCWAVSTDAGLGGNIVLSVDGHIYDLPTLQDIANAMRLTIDLAADQGLICAGDQ